MRFPHSIPSINLYHYYRKKNIGNGRISDCARQSLIGDIKRKGKKKNAYGI